MASQHEPIALIGSACRFPGGSETPSELWELLQTPRDLVRPIPPNRFDAEAYYHPDGKHHGTSNVRHSYFLDQDPAVFDNGFFNIQAGEAEAIDPQQRLLMETVYESLCAAGQTIEGLRGSSTSVFVGVMCDDWEGMIGRDIETFPQYGATGAARSIMSNRISYFFDWHGPCMTIDTACSSSLVAVHQAIQTLQNGESEVAIAAGANLILSPAMYVSESKLSMLSPRGRSRMWDKSVDGYARGEGIASVVLKPLHAALRDHDPIACLIRGTGVNHDGKTLGLTMPSGTAQAALIQETYRRAGLDFNKVEDRPQFFQAHGTGTAAGDPQEAQAISDAFYADSKTDLDEKMYVGSIKTIIGHTEGTAGLASLIGTSLALQHGTIPANLHFHTLNPKLEPFYRHLEVPTKSIPWPETQPGQVRRASINSFGFGGTNAHAILEEYVPEKKKAVAPTTLFSPLTFSAASETSLRSLLSSYADYIDAAGDALRLQDLAYSLQTRTSTLPYRVAIAASTKGEAVAQINAIVGGSLDSTIGTRQMSRATPKILGVFTGQGAQWAHMGAKLLEMSPYVSQRLSELDTTLAALPKGDAPAWTLKEMILAGPEKSRMGEAAVSQPLCTAVQIVLVDLLSLAGVKLEAVIGHSSGEIGAAYAAGLLSARDAITVAYYRGLYAKLAKSPHGSKGAMMAVGTTFEDAAEFCALEDFEGRIQVAARNSLTSITLSGDEDAVREAVEIFKDEGKFARQLRVDTAYHSSHVAPCSAPYHASLDKHEFDKTSPTGVQWYSSVYEGQVLTDGRRLGTQYWVDNMASPVLFAPAATHAWSGSGPFDLVIEVGPHPALQTPCLDTIEALCKDRPPYTGLLARTKDDVRTFSNALGFIWTHLGPGSVDFGSFESGVSQDSTPKHFLTDLPKYPFDHSRTFMALSRSSSLHMDAQEPPHPLLGRRCHDRETANVVQWRNILTPREIPWLLGHQIEHQIIFPATGYVAMAIEAIHVYATTTRKSSVGLITVKDFVIHRPLVFNEDDSKAETLVDLRVVQRSETHLVAEFSCNAGSVYDHKSVLMPHADGTVEVTLATPDAHTMPGVDVDELNLSEVSPDRFYKFLAGLGYHYEWPFHGIQEIHRKADYAFGVMEDQSAAKWEDRLVVHPGMLDTALQTCMAAFSCPGDERMRTLHLPTAIRTIRINPYFTAHGIGKQSHLGFLTVTQLDKNAHLLSDIQLCTAGDPSQAFLQLEGVEFVSLSPANSSTDEVLFSFVESKLANPDGDKASAAAKFTQEDFDVGADMERIAFYYFRKMLATVAEGDLKHSLPHYRHLYEYGEHMVSTILRGEHAHIPASAQDDTLAYINGLVDKRQDCDGVRLVQRVGESLSMCMQSGSSMEDTIKETVLEESLALEQMNACMAEIVGQIAERYPHMNIFEIGNTTKDILAKIKHAFSRYTCTETPTQDLLKDYGDRIAFKTFDMDQSPQTQGFVPGTYDLVICSNVLHTFRDMDATMKSVRSLLRPGGYVVILERVANNLLRTGLTMGSQPGWWQGADTGRPWGPMLDLSQWNSLLSTSGFSGLETSTPHIHDLVPWRVFCAQAVDERVTMLRSPLSRDSIEAQASLAPHQLVLVGGQTPAVSWLVGQLAKLLRDVFSAVHRVSSMEKLDTVNLIDGSSVISVTELDEPLFADPSPAKWNGLKKLWSHGRTILWLTTGVRDDHPHTLMTTSMGRSVRAENPGVTLQFLDLDGINLQTPSLVAEQFMRLTMLSRWSVEREAGEMLWSLEPEMYVENGALLIPRLYPYSQANKRYNTVHRMVTEEVDPAKDRLIFATDQDTLEVQLPSPLSLPNPSLVSNTPVRTIRVTHFLLSSLPMAPGSHLRLVAGMDTTSHETVLALSPTSESPAVVPVQWTISLPRPVDVLSALSALSSYLIAHAILQLATRDTLVVHEPHPSIARFLQDLSHAESSINVCFTTSQKTSGGNNWIYVHEAFPKRIIKNRLPSAPVTFLDLSNDTVTATAITRCLPAGSQIIDPCALGWTSVHVTSSAPVDEITHNLQHAWSTAVQAQSTVAQLSVAALDEVSSANSRWSTIVDCTGHAVQAVVRPIDDGMLFRSDRTYLLVGLSGALGQSLCQWMVEHGAKHVVLSSRKPQVALEFLNRMAQQGAEITVLSMDVTSRTSAHQCYDTIMATLPPVAGVVNGAMVLRDNLFAKMPYEDFVQVTNPKVVGSLVLDELFHNTALDFFILFSSAAAFLGNRGQSNYVAANQFMCSLTAQRKKRGVVGSAIDVSPIVGIGYLERDSVVDEYTFLNQGYRTISETDVHNAFAEAILVGRPTYPGNGQLVTGVAPVYLGEHASESHFADPKLSHFILEREDAPVSTAKSSSAQPVRVQLAAAKGPTEMASILSECFLARLHRILAISPDESINEKMTFVEQGVDSLMAVEVRSWFVKELGLDFSVLKILGGSSIADLLAEAVQLLPEDEQKTSLPEETGKKALPSSPSPPSPPSPALSREVDHASSSASSTDGSFNTSMTPLDSSLDSLPDDITCRMSFGQEGFWFLDQYLADKTAFNMAVMVKLTGPLRVDALERAVELVGARHEILRTRFFWTGDGEKREARQGISSKPLLHLTHRSVGSVAEANEMLVAIRKEPWDLSSRTTSKAFLLTLSSQVHFMILSMHHIQADGYSFGVLWQDLETAYTTQHLSPLPVESQYRSFVHQQRLRFEMGSFDEDIQFHREALSSNEAYLQPIELLPFAPSQAARQPMTQYKQNEATIQLSADLGAKLRNIARKNQSTTFHVYLCALQMMLFQLLPQRTEDIFFGIADANRLDKNFMQSAGFFLNLLPLHFRRSESASPEAIQTARDKVFGALAHSQVPFDVLLRALHVPRSNTHTPLFQVFIDYKKMDQYGADWSGCKLSDETWRNTSTGYDIELDINEIRGVEATFGIRLQDTLYSQENAEVLLRSYISVLEYLAEDSKGPIPAWSKYDVSTALSVGRGCPIQPEWPATIVHRIDDIITAHGDRMAIKDGQGVALTYQQMGKRIDAIAHAIVSSGTPEGALVGVFQEPAADWTCSMLAILRTGRVYVPLDLRNTLPRLASIIQTARPATILTDATTTDLVSTIGAKDLTEIFVSGVETDTETDTLLPNLAKSDAPAVILFTSGSTGTPKGIVLRHENIVIHAEVESHLYGFESAPNLTVLHQSPYSFDLSIDQPFNTLANGGCLIIVPSRSRGDPVEVSQIMLREHVTYASCTPAEFNLWLRFASDNLRRCKDWQYAFSGGEAMHRSLALELQSLHLPHLRVFTGYGPSETTIWMAKIEVDYHALPDTIPTGRLLPAYTCAILDHRGRPVPLGVAGEIVIGGPCVSAGYLHNVESTEQKFLPDPLFGTSPSSRLYHTGDCGRLLADGTVLCEGRLDGDTQVKLRGFRMELAEIESAIVQFADGALSHAVVTMRGSGDQKYLAAHIVFAPAFPQDPTIRDRTIRQIRQNLPLPPYMRPSAIVTLDDVPLTAHNKVDRRAVLALPVTPGAEAEASSLDILNDTERRLSDLWRQVMPVDPGELGPHSDFFLVGGNSILLVKLQSLLRTSFAVAPKLVTLMGAPTLGSMATAVDASQPSYTIDWDVETQFPESIASSVFHEAPAKNAKSRDNTKTTVLVTGSRGYLGRHLVPSLVQDDRISKIYCLVRNPESSEFPEYDKVVILRSDLSQPHLSLADDVYATLAAEIDVIVHCAANRSLWDRYHVLRPDNVLAVRELALLSHAAAAAGRAAVPLHFLSSGAVATYDNALRMQPPIDGSEGYLASKWAAEMFLRRFAAATETPVYIHRPEAATTEIIEADDDGKVMDELSSIADQLGLRPVTDDTKGCFDVTPVSFVVHAIQEAIHDSMTSTATSTEGDSLHMLHLPAAVRVPMTHMQKRLGRDSALGELPSFPLLDWFGKAKSQGLSQFVTAWEFIMGADNRLVSKR